MGKKNKQRGINMTEPETYEPTINTDATQNESKVEESIKENVTPTEPKKEPDMPKPEIKKEEKPVTQAPRVVRQNSNVDKIKFLTTKFEEAYNNREETIGVLISICNYLNTTNDPKVFQTFLGWFTRHIETCMNDQEALRGIHTIQNKRTKTRVEATHQCFIELARVLRSRPRSHYRFTIKSMRAMEISERLAMWLIQRASGN